MMKMWFPILIILLNFVPFIYATDSFNWVEIPPQASNSEIQILIEKKIKSLLREDQRKKDNLETPRFQTQWQKQSSNLQSTWKKELRYREEQVQANLSKILTLQQDYLEKVTALKLYQTTLRVTLKNLQQKLRNLEAKIQNIHLEMDMNHHYIQTQLEDLPYQVAFMGEAKTFKKASLNLSTEEIHHHLQEAIQMSAIQKVNGKLVMGLEEVRHHEVIASLLNNTKQGRVNLIGEFPSLFNTWYDFRERRQGKIHYLFQVLEVYPFQTLDPQNPQIIQIRPSSLDPQPRIFSINSKGDLKSFPNLTPTPKLDLFVGSWIVSAQKHNRKIAQEISILRVAYELKNRASEIELKNLHQKQRETRCSLLPYLANIRENKETSIQEKQWQEQCSTKEAKWPDLEKQLADWKNQVWFPSEREFQTAMRDYQDWYSNHRILWTDQIAYGKIKNGNALQTYQRVSAKAWKSLLAQIKKQTSQTQILSLSPQSKVLSPRQLRYNPIPKRFSILYLSTENTGSEKSHVASLGLEYQLSPQTPSFRNFNLKLPSPPRFQESSTSFPEEEQAQELIPQTSLPKKPNRTPPTWTDPVTGIQFVLVQGGCYEMGDFFQEGNEDERPTHKVCVDDFYLGKYEVTQGQWKKIMKTNPSSFKNGENYPVEGVSWNDVQIFLKKLNSLHTQQFRIPSEAEWEYAAREQGKKVRFGNGKEIATPSEINFDGRQDYKKSYSIAQTYRRKTTGVGNFPPNQLGLHDMSGNIWEWVQDVYESDAYKMYFQKDTLYQEKTLDRVIRGGSWSSDPFSLRAANRLYLSPSYRDYDVGFRLLRIIP